MNNWYQVGFFAIGFSILMGIISDPTGCIYRKDYFFLSCMKNYLIFTSIEMFSIGVGLLLLAIGFIREHVEF